MFEVIWKGSRFPPSESNTAGLPPDIYERNKGSVELVSFSFYCLLSPIEIIKFLVGSLIPSEKKNFHAKTYKVKLFAPLVFTFTKKFWKWPLPCLPWEPSKFKHDGHKNLLHTFPLLCWWGNGFHTQSLWRTLHCTVHTMLWHGALIAQACVFQYLNRFVLHLIVNITNLVAGGRLWLWLVLYEANCIILLIAFICSFFSYLPLLLVTALCESLPDSYP